MKEIGDWFAETCLKFTQQENTNPRRRASDFFYKGMFFVMLMKFSLVVST